LFSVSDDQIEPSLQAEDKCNKLIVPDQVKTAQVEIIVEDEKEEDKVKCEVKTESEDKRQYQQLLG